MREMETAVRPFLNTPGLVRGQGKRTGTDFCPLHSKYWAINPKKQLEWGVNPLEANRTTRSR